MNRDADLENGYVDIGERNWEGGMNWEIRFDKYNTMYRIESQPEPEVQHRELS